MISLRPICRDCGQPTDQLVGNGRCPECHAARMKGLDLKRKRTLRLVKASDIPTDRSKP